MSAILALIMPFLAQGLAACFKQQPASESQTPKQFLASNLDASGEFPDEFLSQHSGATRVAIRRANHGKRPHERTRLRDVDLNAVTAESFHHILSQPDEAVATGYTMALNMTDPIEFNAMSEMNDE